MTYALIVLAVGVSATLVLATRYVFRHMGVLTDQNQLLMSALMATKNSPYAAVAADMVHSGLDDDDETDVVPGSSYPPPDRLGGGHLLGTGGSPLG